MRKQELIHLHGLAQELRAWVTDNHAVDDEFDAYDAHDVSPAEIHRRKEAHRLVVQRAMAGVEAIIHAADDETTAMTEPHR